MDQAAALEIEQQVTPRLRALTDAIGEADRFVMRDPKMSRSDTAGLVAEITDATATKSAKTVKKVTTVTAARHAASDTRRELRVALGLHLTLDRNHEY